MENQHRSYNSYYTVRGAKQLEETSNWRRGSVSWDFQHNAEGQPTDYYSNYYRTELNHNQVYPRYEQEPGNSYELDPRTMEFDRLVELLHPKFISEHLNKIWAFLRSDNQKIAFPNIALYKEAFLVRIASDYNNLDCPVFDDVCRNLSKNIQECIIRNKDVFLWTHYFENGQMSKHILVYKKVYVNSHRQQNDIRVPEINYTMTAPRSTNVVSDVCNTQSRSIQSRNRNDTVTTDFKIKSVKIILDFIKDENKFVLDYPNLSETQANFLCNLLCCYDKPDFDEKSLLCSPLIETLKLFSMKYHFRVSVKDNINDRCIILEKTPRSTLSMTSLNDSLKSPSPSVMEIQDLEDWHTDVENSDTTDQRSDVMSDFGSGSHKNRRKLKYLFDNVTTDFKISAMQASLDYLQDDTRSSLEFVGLTLEESRFLKCLNSFPMARRTRGLIERQCLPLVMKLRTVLEVVKQRYKLRILINVHPNNKLSDVEMTKMPKRERRKRKNAERKRRSGNTDTSKLSDKSEFVSPREKFLKALSLSSDSEAEINKSGREHPSSRCAESKPPVKDVDKTTDRDQKNPASSSIQWQPASAETADGASGVSAGAGKEKTRLTRHKTKLLQAMSVPVESDKAVRMMRLMGWEGGALGRHGDGITEPLIPAIDLVTGAGLGHSPNQTANRKEGIKESKKGEARTAVTFRKEFLENVLDLLRKQDLGEKEIVYERTLSNKEKRFTSTSVAEFNKRRNVGLNSTEEKDYVCRILANLNTMHNLSLAVEFSSNKKQMNIIKNVGTSRRKPRKLSIDRTSEEEILETPTIDNNTITDADIKKTMMKMVRNTRDKGLDLDLGFEEMLTTKYCKFLENVVYNLNKKLNFHCGGPIENELYGKVKRRMDCLLKLSVCDKTYRRLTIKKMYYQKRFVNTAHSPKSNAETESKVDNSLGGDSEGESTDLQADLNALIVNDDTDRESVKADQIDPSRDLNSIPDDKEKNESFETMDQKHQSSIEDHKFITIDDTDQQSATTDQIGDRDISADEKDFMTFDEMDHEYITIDEIGSEIEMDDLETSQSSDSVIITEETEVTKELFTKQELIENEDVNDMNEELLIKEEIVENEDINELCKELFTKKELIENDDIKEDSDATVILDNNDMADILEFSTNIYDELIGKDKNHDTMESVQLHNAVKVEDNSTFDVCTEKIVEMGQFVDPIQITCKNSTLLQVKEENNIPNAVCSENVVTKIRENRKEKSCEMEELDLAQKEENIALGDDTAEKVDTKVTEDGIVIKMEEKNNSIEELDVLVPELSPCSKRSREDSESSDIQISKKTKIYIDDILKVNIAIIPTNYPDSKLNLETVKIIQNEILACFSDIKDDFLPCLKCDGVIDGALKFVCKNYESYLWLKRRVKDMALPGLELKLVHFTAKTVDFHRKMVLSLRSYIKEDTKKLFERLEKLNKWVVTENWTVLNEFWDENNGLMNIILQIDENSYSEIEKRHFSVSTGFDVGVFSEI